jgi:hypothetical protein
MLRDLTMIFSVLVSIASLGFGVYKNVEAGNAKGFAYEQAYRILGVVRDSTIPSSQKAAIVDAALGVISTPPPVIDLSRSSADVSEVPACTPERAAQCVELSASLADANAACSKPPVDTICAAAEVLKNEIKQSDCIFCFTK